MLIGAMLYLGLYLGPHLCQVSQLITIHYSAPSAVVQ